MGTARLNSSIVLYSGKKEGGLVNKVYKVNKVNKVNKVLGHLSWKGAFVESLKPKLYSLRASP